MLYAGRLNKGNCIIFYWSIMTDQHKQCSDFEDICNQCQFLFRGRSNTTEIYCAQSWNSRVSRLDASHPFGPNWSLARHRQVSCGKRRIFVASGHRKSLLTPQMRENCVTRASVVFSCLPSFAICSLSLCSAVCCL